MRNKNALIIVTSLILSACNSDKETLSSAAPSDAASSNSSSSHHAYVANKSDDTVSSYSINSSNGKLNHDQDHPTGSQPIILKKHPSLPYVYCLNANSAQINHFKVDNGNLNAVSVASNQNSVVVGSRGMGIDPQGKYLFVTYDDPSQYVAPVLYNRYFINVDTGALDFDTQVTNNSGAIMSGEQTQTYNGFSYVLSPLAGGYAIEQMNSSLQIIQTVTVQWVPSSIVVF